MTWVQIPVGALDFSFNSGTGKQTINTYRLAMPESTMHVGSIDIENTSIVHEQDRPTTVNITREVTPGDIRRFGGASRIGLNV